MRWRLVYHDGNIPAHDSTGTFNLPFFRHDFSHSATRRLECSTWARINNNSRPKFINEEEGQTHKISCVISFKTHIRSHTVHPSKTRIHESCVARRNPTHSMQIITFSRPQYQPNGRSFANAAHREHSKTNGSENYTHVKLTSRLRWHTRTSSLTPIIQRSTFA